jgi:hypothetical protein
MPAVSASARDALETRLVARYEQTGNITQCAREFGIGWNAAKPILERHAGGRRPGPRGHEGVLRASVGARN